MKWPVKMLLKTSFVVVLPLLGVASNASIAKAQSTDTFTATGNMTTAREDHTATLLTNGKVLLAGGEGGLTYATGDFFLASAELYDPSTGTFAATGDMTTARRGHTATLLADGRVLIAGGYNAQGFLASAELYDPYTGTFTATGQMNSAQPPGHTATLLGNGKVLIAGGGGWAQFLGPYAAGPELYDPDTGMFSGTGDMSTPRYGNTATLLADGTVLIYGGFPVVFRDSKCTEFYDPGTGTFSPARAAGACEIDLHTATLLTKGDVLVAGGEDDSAPFTSAEVYEPSTRVTTATGSMAAGREFHAATLLPDGTVLIAGRQVDNGAALASAELYDPGTGTFSATGNMTTSRFLQTATLLPDGTVLIAGGLTGLHPFTSPFDPYQPTFTAAAELYRPPVLKPAPVLLSVSGDGRGQGLILHSGTHEIVSSYNPAVVGEALEVNLTGLIDGSMIPPQVAIGGRMAEILFFGNAPGFAERNQVTVRVPGGIVPGPAVSVSLTYLGRPSNEVTIGVQ